MVTFTDKVKTSNGTPEVNFNFSDNVDFRFSLVVDFVFKELTVNAPWTDKSKV